MPKFVASRTLKKLAWNNSHLIKGDLAAEVSKLKQQPGQDIVIHGSPGLIRSLLPHGLIDEFRLLVYPLVLGQGKRLFDEGSQASLKLVESTTFSKGVVKLVYRPADKASRAKRTGTARPKRNTKRRKAYAAARNDSSYRRASHPGQFAPTSWTRGRQSTTGTC